MHCRQCHESIPGDWIEWRQRHVLNLGDRGHEISTVEAVVICAPPRVCAQEYAEAATERASRIAQRAASDEPF